MYGRWYEPLVYLTISLHNLTYVVIQTVLYCATNSGLKSCRLETPFKLYVAVAVSQLACDCYEAQGNCVSTKGQLHAFQQMKREHRVRARIAKQI